MKTVILCGGLGTRLSEETHLKPKPMVEVDGRPILWHQVQLLKRYKIFDVVFLTGYKHEVVRDYFGTGDSFGIRAFYSRETESLGRGGAIKKGIESVGDLGNEILVLNGDLLLDMDLHDFLSVHSRNESSITMLIRKYRSEVGIVELDKSMRITGFNEKPEMPYWINGGVYVMNVDLACRLPLQGDHETELLPDLCSEGEVMAYTGCSYWKSIDSVKDLEGLEWNR